MDLNTIASRAGLPPRRLRYTLEHEVVPGLRQREGGHGLDWDFTLFEAFGLSLAALLLSGGIRRDVVAAVLREVVAKFGRNVKIRDVPLFAAFSAQEATLTIADGHAVRVVAIHSKGRPGTDTGWLPLGPDSPTSVPTPIVRVEVDLAALRDRLGT